MKKILLVVLFAFIITGCSIKEEKTNDDLSKEKINYIGKYDSTEDSSYVLIEENNGVYTMDIDLFRLTVIEDTVCDLDEENNIMIFEGIDAEENIIKGKVEWDTEDKIKLTFTDSTWEYLPNGTEFYFERGE